MIQHKYRKNTIQAGIHQFHLVVIMIYLQPEVFPAFGKVKEIENNKSVVEKGNQMIYSVIVSELVDRATSGNFYD